MMKKLGFFLFATCLSASYAMAGGGEQACYAQCDDNLDQCVLDRPTSVGVCTKIHSICYERCDHVND